MFTKIAIVTIPVKDQDVSKKFYNVFYKSALHTYLLQILLAE